MARILVIDDSGLVCSQMRLILGRSGHEILLAHQGDEGWTQFLDHRPDIICLDTHLPGIDGVSLCARMRQSDASCPIIMMHQEGDAAMSARCLNAGATRTITKPLHLNEIVDAIAEACRQMHHAEA